MLALAVQKWPWHADTYLLWADVHLTLKDKAKALDVLQKALSQDRMTPRDRQRLTRKLNGIKGKAQD